MKLSKQDIIAAVFAVLLAGQVAATWAVVMQLKEIDSSVGYVSTSVDGVANQIDRK